MNEKTLKELLLLGESEVLDYKRQSYFSNNVEGTKKEKDADYLKDIICFGNTVRNKSAFILIGVDEVSGKGKIVGLNQEDIFDDEIFQQKLKDKLSPVPKIRVHNLDIENKQVQVIEIPVVKYNRPIFPIVTVGNKIIKNKVYLRRGTSNGEAQYDEIIRLRDWLESLPISIDLKEILEAENNNPSYEVAIFDNFQALNLSIGGETLPGNIKFYIKSIFHKKSSTGKNDYYKNYLFDNLHNIIPDNTIRWNNLACEISTEEYWGKLIGNHNSVILQTKITDRLGKEKEERFSNSRHQGEGIVALVKHLKKLDLCDTHKALELLEKKEKEIEYLKKKIEKSK